MKKKILYMSQVDWNWIKQRPQFIAEGLAEKFDVSILYMYQVMHRETLQKRDLSSWDITPIYPWIRTKNLRPLLAFARWFARAQFLIQYKRVRPDYIYLTFPTQIEYLPNHFNGKLLYDCMDDHLAMAPAVQKDELQHQEQKMLERANVVLVSSENLKNVLINRHGAQYAEKMHLVRNGYTGDILPAYTSPIFETELFTISYIGTISRWFNFEYILKSLEDIPNLRYRIIGPSDIELPQADRLIYTGTVEHRKLFDVIRNDNCLMMPFVVNEIVASVDPVKLYEYINYNKNILCVYYPEIERFDPYVHFYNDYDSFLAQIKTLMNAKEVKYCRDERIRFLEKNNWKNRVETICQLLDPQK